ncbi:MAG: hypothetical protein GX100_01275, partial [candidate division WS1 bacterium]|nr:hypothetical protein [candidate division WS1 bacterium]
MRPAWLLLILLVALGALPLAAEEPPASPATAAGADAAEPQPAPPPAGETQTQPAAETSAAAESLVGMLLDTSDEQFGRLAELINTQYPTLSDELVKYLFDQQPDLLAQLLPTLVPILVKDYPDVGRIIGSAVRHNDQLKLRVGQVVEERYPGFAADLQQIPRGPNRRQQAADLIAAKYSALMAVMVDVLQKEFPTLLNGVRLQVEQRYPHLLGDIA